MTFSEFAAHPLAAHFRRVIPAQAGHPSFTVRPIYDHPFAGWEIVSVDR